MFFDRLQTLCESSGLKISNFVKDVLDVSSSAASGWKKGAIPSSSVVIKSAEYFGVSTDYLLGLDDIPTRRQQDLPTQAEMEMLSQFRAASPAARAIAWATAQAALGAAMSQPIGHALALDEPVGHLFDQDKSLGHSMSIPASKLLIEGYAAAGSPLFDPNTDEKTVSVKEKYTAKDMDGNRFFVVVARGDSMEPVIPDGTPVVVQRALKPLSGEVALVALDNSTDEPEYAIKMVRYLPDKIELSSYNEAHKPYTRPLSEVISIEKVVHILNDV